MSNKDYIILGVVTAAVLILGAFLYIKSQSQSLNKPQEQPSVPKVEEEVVETTESSPEMPDKTRKTYQKPPEMSLNPTRDYSAVIKTSMGDIKLDLFEKSTPVAVNNFVFLSKEGFYNGVKFHRIIKGFMIQTGDPLGNGTGGPGYKFNDEPFEGEYTEGTVAMANSGKNTNGSQFFIMHKDTPLPKNYVIFGRVTDEESLGVVDKIANVPVRSNALGEASVPTQTVTVNSVEIIEGSGTI